MFHVPEKYRITNPKHPMATDSSFGNNGAFTIKLAPDSYAHVIASDGMGWEHVSVHITEDGSSETPVWEEMCRIKALFWDEEDCVLQFHPPKSEYVNQHENVLHMWRKIGFEQPVPESILVGLKKKK